MTWKWRSRLVSLVLRPTTPPLWLGVVVAASLIAMETALVHLFRHLAPGNAFGAVFLLGVLVVSARWGFGLAVATTIASAVVYLYIHLEPDGGFIPDTPEDWLAIIIFLPIALLANILGGQARLRAVEADQRRRDAEAHRDEMRVLADELAASRARIVTAGDEARRRLERDLHDGAQQRLVSLGLQMRLIEGSIPDRPDLEEQISDVVQGLTGVSEELQELSRGIHPAILSRGGLSPALKTLARRSAVPVELHLTVDRRLPLPVEVAAYYVVAEALTNVAKHAQASHADVTVGAEGGALHLLIEDDGVGGADSENGSGLVGLRDRVEALYGSIEISSPPGGGTSLRASIPFNVDVPPPAGK